MTGWPLLTSGTWVPLMRCNTGAIELPREGAGPAQAMQSTLGEAFPEAHMIADVLHAKRDISTGSLRLRYAILSSLKMNGKGEK